MSFPFRLPMLLDGATATQMIAAGMPAQACPEAWILEHPDLLISLQKEYIAAGSDAVLAPTFGANRSRLASFGLSDQVREMNLQLVELSRRAVGDSDVYIAGNLSSTGLSLAPYGDSYFDEVLTVYREQCAALKEAEVDFLFCETMTSLSDARAAVLAAREVELPILVTFTVDETGRTPSEGELLPAVITLQSLGADAVGLNCSLGPASLLEPIQETIPHASVPLIAKPCAGLVDSGKDALSPDEFAAAMLPLLKAGVLIVGGCCGRTPAHIAALRHLLDTTQLPGTPDPDDFAAAVESEAFFLSDDLELSEPLDCEYDLADRLIDIEDEEGNVACVRVHNEDDAQILSEYAHMSRQPICISADQPEVLDRALKLFPGRALVDSETELEREEVEDIAERYGAIVF